MRAIVVERPGTVDALRWTEIDEPHPGPGELSIEVRYAGVGFVDTLFRSGRFDLPTPFVPGIEVAGRVRAVGAGVEGFVAGQPVGAMLNDFGRGPRAAGYAEIAVAHASMATPVPEGVDLAHIAAVLVNGVTAWMALRDLARTGPRADVLVLGASGGLGGTACRVAAALPAGRVFGVVSDPERTRQVPVDCDATILAADLESRVAELTAGRGVDVVVDPVGGLLRPRAFDVLAPMGRLVVLGNAANRDEALSGDAAWLGSRQILGLSLGGVAHLVPDQVETAGAAIVGLVARGLLREPAPAVLPLERVSEVHLALEGRSAPAKTVLLVSEDQQ